MKKVTIVLILALALILILTACPSSPTPTQTTTPAKTPATVTTQTSATPTIKTGGILKFVPQNISNAFGFGNDFVTSGSQEAIYPCVETICGVDSSGAFVPTKLTTAYQVAPDHKSITLTLRKGVKFHDGTAFDAQAAKWNLEILKRVKNPGTAEWTTIDVVDDYTVRINLRSWSSLLMIDLASGAGPMLSPASVEKNGEEWARTHLVGTGPFKFVSFTPDVGMTYQRFDDYWGGKPILDGINIVFIQDDMAKSAALRAGEVDIVSNLIPEQAYALQPQGYNVGVGVPPVIQFMFPDSTHPDSPLANLKVRQAVEYAVDRNELSKLGGGVWKATNQPCEPGSPGYIANFEGRQYNPDKAKQLLAEAGYANGCEIKLLYSTSMSSTDSMVSVQQYLGKVGIIADLQVMTGPQRTEYMENGWQNGFILYNAWAGLNFISSTNRNLSPQGFVFVSTARPDGLGDLLDQAISATDTATYEASAEKIVHMLYDNSTIIALWVAYRSVWVQQPWVQDADFHVKWGAYDWTPAKAWLNK